LHILNGPDSGPTTGKTGTGCCFTQYC